MLVKMGHTGPLVEPHRGLQAGKSGNPRSQNADSSPRAQGALGLGFEAKPKGKCGAVTPTMCHDRFFNKIFIERPIPFTDQ